jgi:Spy/CpxP family protein refolding chaperone
MFLAVNSLALAQNPPESVAVLKNRLGLTVEQVGGIKELQKKHREDTLPLQEQLRAKNQALRAALEPAQPKVETVGQIVIEQQALRKQLQALNVKLRNDIFTLLTPQQKRKIGHLGLVSLGEIARRHRR